MRSHVLLAACRADEQALENQVTFDGQTRGMFTFHLPKYLRWAYTEKDYMCTSPRRLAGPGGRHFSAVALDGHYPLCEGMVRDRMLFSGTQLARDASSFTMIYEGMSLVVNAGRITVSPTTPGLPCKH